METIKLQPDTKLKKTLRLCSIVGVGVTLGYGISKVAKVDFITTALITTAGVFGVLIYTDYKTWNNI